MKLEVGQKAPPFRLPSTDGSEISLEDLRGETVVLYFYPRDMTPGCTREACDFRDRWAGVKKRARLLGVSKDSLVSHAKFRGQHRLPFPLLSDADNAVAKAYGAYGEKKLYGRPVVGTIRSTFVIDGSGRVAAAWSPVRVDGHADAVLGFLSGEAAPPEPRPAKSRSEPPKASPERRGPRRRRRSG